MMKHARAVFAWLGEWSGVLMYAGIAYYALTQREYVFAVWFACAIVHAWAAVSYRRSAQRSLELSREMLGFAQSLDRIARMRGTEASDAPRVAYEALRDAFEKSPFDRSSAR